MNLDPRGGTASPDRITLPRLFSSADSWLPSPWMFGLIRQRGYGQKRFDKKKENSEIPRVRSRRFRLCLFAFSVRFIGRENTERVPRLCIREYNLSTDTRKSDFCVYLDRANLL